MALEHWVTLVPDTKSLEKGIKKAFDAAKKDSTVEVKVDKGKAGKSGKDAGRAIDAGAKDATKDTGKDVGAQIDKGARGETKDTGKEVGKSVDKGAKDATKDTGKDVGTKIGKDLGQEAEKSGKSAGTALGTALGEALGSIVKRNVNSVLNKVISGDIQGAARDVSSALNGLSGGLANIQNITGSDNFIGRGIGRLRDVVDNASASVGGLADSFSSVSAGIGAINDTKDAAMQLVDAFNGAKDGVSNVSDLLGKLEQRAPALAAALGKIAGPLIEIAGAAGAVGWVQDHLPEGLQGRNPTINKNLGPNQGKGLSGRDWGHDFTHPWEIPQRIWRNFFDDDAGSDGPVASSGDKGPVPGVGGSLGDAINSALTDSAPSFNYKPGESLGDAINGALSGSSREDVLPDMPISEYRIGGGLGDAIRDAQALDREARDAQREADKARREAERQAKAAERADGQAKRQAQREADRAQREAERAQREADRQADRAAREAARGTTRGSSNAGGGLTPHARSVQEMIQRIWPQITTIGGYRPPDGKYNEHSTGNALDVMIPNWNTPEGKALGDAVTKWAMQNADSLGLSWAIWRQTQYGGNAGPNGSPMEDRGDPTQNHMDHVHLFMDNKKSGRSPMSPSAGERISSVGGSDVFAGGPLSADGFYAWVVPMSGDGVAAAGGPAGGSAGGALPGGFGGGAGGGNSVLSELRNIGEGGAKETFLPAGFSDPTTWPNVKSGMALLNIFGGMLGKSPGQGLIGDTRDLTPGELNPAITAGGSASLLGGAAGMMTQLTQGGVAGQPGQGPASVDQSINFNGNVDGDVSKGLAKANTARIARTRVTTGPLPL